MSNLQGDTVRKEPVAIIDTTGLMNEHVASGNPTTKRSLATQVLRGLVQELASEDTQGADEEGGGGLLTLTFADGVANEVGDLNPTNFEQKWASVHWGGGTYITPALELAMENFKEEFGHLPGNVQPKLALAILTDGALFDLNAATSWLRSVSGNVYVGVIVVGSGVDHDQTVAQWSSIAEHNPHVTVEAAQASSDAHAIAARMLTMLQ